MIDKETGTWDHGMERRDISKYPTYKTICLYDDYEKAKEAAQALMESDIFAANEVEAMTGEEAVDSFDPDGTHHGLLTNIIRIGQRFLDTGESEELKNVQAEAQKGHSILLVTTKTYDQMNELDRVVAETGGRKRAYFSPYYVEHFNE